MTIFDMLDAVREFPSGDYAEAGVWQGWMAEKIAAGMNPKQKLWLFDSFQGHEEPGRFDDAYFHPKGRYADTSPWKILELIPKAMVTPGWIQYTLGVIDDKQFRFVNIDLDHYEPTKVAAEFFKSRMVPGGIIRFDDYNHPETPGATRAIDEVFGRENVLPEDFRWVA